MIIFHRRRATHKKQEPKKGIKNHASLYHTHGGILLVPLLDARPAEVPPSLLALSLFPHPPPSFAPTNPRPHRDVMLGTCGRPMQVLFFFFDLNPKLSFITPCREKLPISLQRVSKARDGVSPIPAIFRRSFASRSCPPRLAVRR